MGTAAPMEQAERERLIARASSGKRIRVRARSPSHINPKRVRVGTARQLLASFISAHYEQFPTEQRLILAAQGNPLPSDPCCCEKCLGRKQGWPANYRWTATRKGHGDSYECGLHRQSKWFLRHLPSSSSIVKFGGDL